MVLLNRILNGAAQLSSQAFNTSVQNNSAVGMVVSGVGMTALGFFGLVKSGVPTALKNLVTNRSNEGNKPRYQLAALSALTMTAGVALTLRGGMELFPRYSPSTNFPANQESTLAKPVPTECTEFVDAHKSEIEVMIKSEKETGQWRSMSRKYKPSSFKLAFAHPEMPLCVVKTAQKWSPSESHLMMKSHVRNVEIARDYIENHQLDHLVVPASALFYTQSGPIIIEDKFELENFDDFNSSGKTAAHEQLKEFIVKGEFSDIILPRNHNAGFIKGTESDPKIGLYDLDSMGETYDLDQI